MRPASAYESPSTSAARTQSPMLKRAPVRYRTAPVIAHISVLPRYARIFPSEVRRQR